jgi:RimM protein, required for 16S rRNA processing
MPQYIHIGRFVASFGVNGELILDHRLNKKTLLKNIEALFVEEVRNSYLPYFIQSAKAKSNHEIIVSIEGVGSKEAAQKFIQKNVWLNELDFKNAVAKNSTASLIGYMLIDGDNELSVIEDIIEQAQQVLAKITVKEKEVFVPLHPELLQKINHRAKKIYINLPDGLLEVYGVE